MEENNLLYYETSAKNSTNVQEMFIGVAKIITEKKQSQKNGGQDKGGSRLKQ